MSTGLWRTGDATFTADIQGRFTNRPDKTPSPDQNNKPLAFSLSERRLGYLLFLSVDRPGGRMGGKNGADAVE